jgi:hypothetical protein
MIILSINNVFIKLLLRESNPLPPQGEGSIDPFYPLAVASCGK